MKHILIPALRPEDVKQKANLRCLTLDKKGFVAWPYTVCDRYISFKHRLIERVLLPPPVRLGWRLDVIYAIERYIMRGWCTPDWDHWKPAVTQHLLFELLLTQFPPAQEDAICMALAKFAKTDISIAKTVTALKRAAK